ncbi:MAG: hypothetical protein J7L53_09615 [Deltaproteobacteria bacterium]|nr:hypothetical protein [Deltaproteobacteria bacterium]
MRKNLLFLVCFLGLSICVYGQEPTKIDITLNKAELEAGKLQVFVKDYYIEGKGEKKRVIGAILIDAPPAKVWDVLDDWDSMGDFVPSLEHYKTIHVVEPSEEGISKETLIEGKLKIPLFEVVYTLDVKFDKANLRQDWRLVTKKEAAAYKERGINIRYPSAGLKNIEGFEYIEPYDNGRKTIYYYAPVVESSIPLPGFAERAITKSTLPDYMDAIKKRVESGGMYKKRP